jgi:integrase/recombinase XerD
MLKDDEELVKRYFMFGSRFGGELSDGTQHEYMAAYNDLLNFTKKPMKETTEEDIENFCTFLKSRNKRKRYGNTTDKKMRNTTIRTRINELKGLFRYMTDKGMIKENPIKVKFKQDPEKEIRILKQILSHDEVDRLFEIIKNPRDSCLFGLLYANGLRISETLDLKKDDIDFQKGVMIIHGKGDKYRINELKACIIRRLQLWLTLREDLISKDCEYIFVTNKGQRLSSNAARKLFKKYCELAKIEKKVTIHSLRHTHITHSIEFGIPLPEIAYNVGHNRINTTMIYTHVTQMNRAYLSKFRDF